MTLSEFDDLLGEISERAYCSGWQSGIEFELWMIVVGARDPRLGQTSVTAGELLKLRHHLANESSWVTFDKSVDEPKLIDLDRWLIGVDAYRTDPRSVLRYAFVDVPLGSPE